MTNAAKLYNLITVKTMTQIKTNKSSYLILFSLVEVKTYENICTGSDIVYKMAFWEVFKSLALVGTFVQPHIHYI